jgi:hypothetical protein
MGRFNRDVEMSLHVSISNIICAIVGAAITAVFFSVHENRVERRAVSDKYYMPLPVACISRAREALSALDVDEVRIIPYSYKLPSLWDYQSFAEISVGKNTPEKSTEIAKTLHMSCVEHEVRFDTSGELGGQISNWIALRRRVSPEFSAVIRISKERAYAYYFQDID